MPSIPFIKASACGNDFLLVDHAILQSGELAPRPTIFSDPEITRLMCDRHNGVGADGVEWMLPDPACDTRISLVNADGSPAEISGNGTRCVAALLVSQTGKREVTIRTDAGVKACTLIKQDGRSYEFEAAMGEPQVGDPFSVKLAFREVTGVPVSMGNPHFVIFVDEFATGWQAEAAEIGRHHDFKYGINVELVKIENKHAISALFFERGAGETQSSGTGSCASVVASIFTDRVESPVEVHTAGGTQVVRWERGGRGEGEVFLQGAAQIVCRGEFFL